MQLLSETFTVPRRTERDVIKNVFWSLCTAVRYCCQIAMNETGLMSTDFRKILKYQIPWNPVQWEPSSLRTDRQTGRSDEANSRFLQFCVHTKKKTCFLPRMALTVVCKARLIAAYIRYTGCSWNWRQTETLWTWASIRWGHLVCGKKNYLGDGIQCCRF